MEHSPRLFLTFFSPLLAAQLLAQATVQNNTLRGKVLYQSSGNKPAAGVRITEPDANPAYSVDNGDYVLIFQQKRNGATLTLEVGKDNNKGQKLELVNEKEVKAAKLPASAEDVLDIIVCPEGQRDIAAQKYYRILRTTADRELEKVKKEFVILVAQKATDFQKITDLSEQITRMQAALDSSKIREQAFSLASINLDRASQLVKDAVKKIDEENDVDGALKILNTEALDTAYQHASVIKRRSEAIVKKANIGIKQVIEGYKFRISLLEPKFKYGEIVACYEKIVEIYEKEDYDKLELAVYLIEMGYYHGLNGSYLKELEFDQKALSIREKMLPAEHPDLAQSYNNLAVTYNHLSEYQKALEFNIKVLAIQEIVFPVNLPLLANSYNNLAESYRNLGDYQKALEYHLKTLAIWSTILFTDDTDLARSYNNLAATYYNLGEYQKAMEFNLKALDILEKTLPDNHPNLKSSYNNLSLAYGKLGEYQKQLEFEQKALAICEKILSADHPQLGISYNNLAGAYRDLGEHQKRLEFEIKALSILEKSLPPEHLDLAGLYGNLAGTYRNLNEYQKALEYGLKALTIRERALPADHPLLALSYNSLAGIYRNLGEHQKAVDLLLKALAVEEKILPHNHPNLARYYSNIGVAFRDLHEYKKGIEYSQKAIFVGGASDTKHPNLNRFYINLGITYIKMHQYPEAKAALEKSESLKVEEGAYRGWAMYHALRKKKKQAIESLQKAASLGFKDLKWLETEPDLKNIRKEKAYKDLVEQLKKQ